MARLNRGRSLPALRRKTVWGLGPEAALTPLTGSAVNGWSLFSFPIVQGATLIRTRGEIMLWLTAATALNDGFRGAVGIAVTTVSAATIGATAIPSPITDDDWDGWLWHHYFSLRAPGPIVQAAVALQTDNSLTSSVRYEIDSKAMRKIPDSEFAIVGVLEVALTGTAVMAYEAQTRLLAKLS